MDSEAGLDGRFNASKEKVRAVLKGMLDSGRVETQPVADADRSLHGVPKQVKGILRVKSAAKPAEPLIAEGEKTG